MRVACTIIVYWGISASRARRYGLFSQLGLRANKRFNLTRRASGASHGILRCNPSMDGSRHPEYFWILENQWAQITAVPLLALYNGERGRAGFKWLFYGIYPAHLWLFYVVSNLIPR